MIAAESHYAPLAAAYARGALREPALDDEAALARAAAAGLDLHRFKRSSQLPRVRAVLGALRGFAPDRLVDLGSGRGAFVWPLIQAFDFLELDPLQIEIPLAKWNRIAKNVHSDRKLVGGLLLDFAKNKDRVGAAVSSDRLLAEYQRVVLDATAALIEAGVLVLERAAETEE